MKIRSLLSKFFFGPYSVYNNGIVGAVLALSLHVFLGIENKLILFLAIAAYSITMLALGLKK